METFVNIAFFTCSIVYKLYIDLSVYTPLEHCGVHSFKQKHNCIMSYYLNVSLVMQIFKHNPSFDDCCSIYKRTYASALPISKTIILFNNNIISWEKPFT